MSANLPSSAVMRELSRIALEKATESLAKLADEMAEKIPHDVSGKAALIIFADTIRNTNKKQFGRGVTQ